MDNLAHLWDLAPPWMLLVVLGVIGVAIVLATRVRISNASSRDVEPTPESDVDVLDSSHIGFAPLGGVTDLDAGALPGSSGNTRGDPSRR